MLDEVLTHLQRGGAATMSHPGVYPVAEGAISAPARYAGRRGSEFVFERRFIDGDFRQTVLIDSKGSQSNRAEDGLATAIDEGGPAAALPLITVAYGSRSVSDISLPHRAVDAHIRAASQNGQPVVGLDWYRALRDATPVDLSPVFTVAPAMLAFGGWDSSRKSGQLRLRSAYVSELFGVVATDGDPLSRRTGGRLDPLGQQFLLEPDDMTTLLDRLAPDMSDETVAKIRRDIEAARKKGERLRPSRLGLGGVPPTVGGDAAYGVAVPEVRRARTYSLAALRRLRFGGSVEEDVAARAALLGLLLVGAAYADADPDIRAYCDVGAPRGSVRLDDRDVDFDLSIESCSAFLQAAVERLPERLAWAGQRQELVGSPGLDSGAADEPEE